MIVLEFASGSGKEERDKTSLSESRKKGTRPGKFWVYEQIIGVPYYGIYEIQSGKLEVYHLFHGFYHQLEPNERGHYPIDFLPVELGLWRGNYQNQTLLWLRWWDKDGNLLLTGQEQAELEKVHTERERKRADRLEKEKTDAEGSLIEAISRLQQLGLSAEQIASALNLSVELVQNSIIN